jgi:hypothetical protein
VRVSEIPRLECAVKGVAMKSIYKKVFRWKLLKNKINTYKGLRVKYDSLPVEDKP